MNSKIERFKRAVFVVCFLILLLSNKVLAVVKPTSNFYVNDYANLLSTETENYIMSVNQNLQSQTKAQVVVVTVPTLEEQSLEEYATELFRNFGIGDKTLNNGVLLLIALQERQSRIEVGYGLEGILNDAKTGRIQDEYMIPYLRQNNWNEGIKNGFNAIIQELEKEYQVQVGGQEATAIANLPYKIITSNLSILMISSIVLTVIIRIITNNRRKESFWRRLYLILLIIMSAIILKSIRMVIMVIFFNFLVMFSKGGSGYSGGGYSSGGGGFSSGGGFSGGGGSSGGGRKF